MALKVCCGGESEINKLDFPFLFFFFLLKEGFYFESSRCKSSFVSIFGWLRKL